MQVEQTGIFHHVIYTDTEQVIDYFRVFESPTTTKIILYNIGRLTINDNINIPSRWELGSGFDLNCNVGYGYSCWWKTKHVATSAYGAIEGARVIKTNGFNEKKKIGLYECHYPSQATEII